MKYKLTRLQYDTLLNLYNNYNEAFKTLDSDIKSRFEDCLYHAGYIGG